MKTKLKKGSIDMFVVAPGVWGMKDVFVNIYMIKNDPSEEKWWLVDTGLKWAAGKIKGMADILFGEGSRPEAIILTHGHFDHVGSVKKLAEEWNVPVYAHHLEIPYLTGMSSYPPADPAAGGGLLADISFLYPKGPIDIGPRVVSLPAGGRIPGLSAWRYIHTPGHAPGHISLFRDSDRVLVAGDAIVTTKAESILSTIFQFKKVSGPPKYFTSDWLSADSSVEALVVLEPDIIVSGHGRPMRGAGMRKSLHNLALNFQRGSVPSKGRYTHQPALMDDSGVVHIPPKNIHASAAPTLKILGISAAILLTLLLVGKKKKHKKSRNFKIADKHDVNKYKQIKKSPELPAISEEFHRLKFNVNRKARAVSKRVRNKADKVKEPAIDMLETLKFNVKKRLK